MPGQNETKIINQNSNITLLLMRPVLIIPSESWVGIGILIRTWNIFIQAWNLYI